MKKRILLGAFLGLLIAVGVLVYWGQWRVKHAETFYSGTIEAKEAHLSFQAPGRVINVPVREGQKVEKDELLAEIEPSEFVARHEQARANLERAVKTVQQLETILSVYSSTLPSEVVKAEAAVTAARRVEEDAKRNRDRYESLYQEQIVTQKDRDAFRLNAETAAARLTEAEAVLQQARINLRKIEATRREIEATRAQVDQAKAALEQSAIQLSYTKLRAPFRGIITSRNVEPGEVVTAFREVLTLADLTNIDLKIFVGETEIGTVKPGQAAEVRIDTFPGKVYRGVVTYVSPEGEFTPKIIQTKKERVKLVYMVKITVPNPDLELKTGMPADVRLR